MLALNGAHRHRTAAAAVFVVVTARCSFGLVTGDVLEAKKEERAKRFGLAPDSAEKKKLVGASTILANKPTPDLEKVRQGKRVEKRARMADEFFLGQRSNA